MAVSKKSMKWIPWILILPVVIIRGIYNIVSYSGNNKEQLL